MGAGASWREEPRLGVEPGTRELLPSTCHPVKCLLSGTPAIPFLQRDSGNGDTALDGEEVKKAAIPATGCVPGFLWKDYLPSLFQALREAFGIDNG